MKKNRLISIACCLLLATSLQAQSVGFVSREQSWATLPETPHNLSVIDSNLYFYSSQVLLKASRQGDDIVAYVPDTLLVKQDEGINYAVRQPSTGDIYFTRLDRKGRSCLYFSHTEGKRTKTKRLKMDDIEVKHPTFSADGRVMVFSSRERRRSYGGHDLWYSRFRDGEWSTPVNLGNRVNSPGDELTPCIVGDYLYFSSDGREESRSHLNIYATRLIANQVTGDTIGMLQIGRSRVQQLPQGINSAVSDCYDFVIDTHAHCCYWVNAASGIRSYNGTLNAVTLWGHIYSTRNKPLSAVQVSVYDGDRPVAMTSSRDDGFYRITLPAGASYAIRYHAPLRFAHRYQLKTESDKAGNLIGEVQHDLTLDSLPVGHPFYLTDLFGPDAVVDLSAHGIEVLQPLIAFLTDNPDLKADLTLVSNISSNTEFNALLTTQRLQRLKDYLQGNLPSNVVVRFHSGTARPTSGTDSVARLNVLLKK